MSVRLSFKATSLVVAGAVATTLLVGCSPAPTQTQPQTQSVSADEEFVQVCQDEDTQLRVEDELCEGDLTNSHYYPSYYPYSSMIPAIGAGMIAGYLMSPPKKSTVYRGAVPRTGGYAPVTRPNSGFLKVPADFVGGVPPVAPAPTSVPAQAATTPAPRVSSPAQQASPNTAPTTAPRATTAPAPVTGTQATKAPSTTDSKKKEETKRTETKRETTTKRSTRRK